MHTTPRLALRLPDGTGDAPDVPLWMERLALDLEGSFAVGLLADRPVAGKAGRRYFASDAKVEYVDTDATWELVGQPADGSIGAAKLAATLKPSGGAAAGTEALRAIGSGPGQVLAGNDVSVPAYVTTLPSSPADGQEIYYRPTTGVIWHLRYNAGSGSSYKWEAVGGQTPLYDYAPGASSVYSSAGTVSLPDGPSLTLPAGVGGDFLVYLACACSQIADVGFSYPGAHMGYAVNGTVIEVIALTNGSQNWALYTTASEEFRHLAMPAGAAVTCRYTVVGGSGFAWFNRRALALRPLRIG
jgi:hypothetical protein